MDTGSLLKAIIGPVEVKILLSLGGWLSHGQSCHTYGRISPISHCACVSMSLIDTINFYIDYIGKIFLIPNFASFFLIDYFCRVFIGKF